MTILDRFGRRTPEARATVTDVDRLENAALQALARVEAGLGYCARMQRGPDRVLMADLLIDVRTQLRRGLEVRS